MTSKPYTIPHTVMVQVVDDETLLFDSNTGLFFSLNESGALMWDSISAYSNLTAVYDEMIEAFEVDSKQMENDGKILQHDGVTSEPMEIVPNFPAC